MKYILSSKIVFLANKAAKIPFVKPLLKPFYYKYKDYLAEKRKKVFHQNALNTLKQFDECMRAHDFKYVLMFGSMLGAVREKGFISHDMDMDVAMWYEDYTPEIKTALESAGFKLIHYHEIDGGVSAKEDTYEKDGISIDIFFIYPAIDEYPYICSKWHGANGCITKQQSMKKYGYIEGKRLELPFHSKDIEYVPFESLSLPIPVNAHEILKFYYGEDYLSPNKTWVEAKDFPYRKPWVGKKAMYYEF